MLRFWNSLMFFAIAIGAITTWQAPRLITWYVKPPVEWGVTCTPALEWSMTRLIWCQTAGVAVGAVIGIYFYFAFIRRKSKEPADEQNKT